MKLTIIIPYYKTLIATKKLLNKLIPQLTNEVEVIVVDDGCGENTLDDFPVKVIHLPKNSGGASRPRNVGLDHANGEYIAFIDSDDMVSNDYVESILNALDGKDYYLFSWAWKNGQVINITNEPPHWNYSVWNCVYKKDLIGESRFNESLVIGEDRAFNEAVRHGTKGIIPKVLYHYHEYREGSLTRTAQTYQTVIYYKNIQAIGGVEQWLYMMAKLFHKSHDITIMYRTCPPQQLARLRQFVRCEAYQGQRVYCDTFIFCYNAEIIENIEAKNYHLFIHADFKANNLLMVIPERTTQIYAVSENVKEKFIELHQEQLKGREIKIAYNPNVLDKFKPLIRLISATRLTSEKGYWRMKKLAQYLNANGVKFKWDIFTTSTSEPIANVMFHPPDLNILPYIAKADFLVQLSDTEGYAYTLVEALQLGVPLIVTALPVLGEMGVNDSNAIILDFDMENIEVVKKRLYEEFKFDYKPNLSLDLYEKEILGRKAKSNYQKELLMKTKVRATKVWQETNLTDTETGQVRKEGEEWEVTPERLNDFLTKRPDLIEVVEIPKRTPKKAVAKKTPTKKSTVAKSATKQK